MRKGFLLVELLSVFVAMLIAMAILGYLFRVSMRDIPKLNQITQVNTTLQTMLDRMRLDINDAADLPDSFGTYTSGPDLLLIETTNGTIAYQKQTDRIARIELTADPFPLEPTITESTTPEPNSTDPVTAEPNTPPESTTANLPQQIWSCPQANVQWTRWTKNQKTYAVEVHTSINYKPRLTIQKKLANAQLFFVAASAVNASQPTD